MTKTGLYPEYLTLAQYRRVFFRPDAHFIEGKIIPRNLGDSIHGRTISFLIGKLHAVCDTLDLSCCISLRLQISATHIRVCDFVILAASASYEPVPTTPPLLCVEILAPDQTPDEELDTLADYRTMGVPNIWLIDPHPQGGLHLRRRRTPHRRRYKPRYPELSCPPRPHRSLRRYRVVFLKRL